MGKAEKDMSFWRFEEGGRVLSIRTADTPAPWKNMLFNDGYMLDLTERMQGSGVVLTPDFRTSEQIAQRREMFVRIDGKPYRLLAGAGESYECRQMPEQSEMREQFAGFSTSVRAFVPVEGAAEIWTVTLQNDGDKPFAANVFTCFELTKAGTMGQCARYDAATDTAYRAGFPYYVYYDEYEGAKKKKNICFVTSNETPAGYETSLQRFFGTDNPYSIPAPVKAGHLACGQSDDGATCGALQFDFTLAPGEKKCIHLLCGVTADIADVPVLKERYLRVEERLAEVRELWDERLAAFHMESPDADLNAMVNVWLKKQALFLGRLNRASTYCPIRNQLQDAMGYAMVDPDGAFEVICRVMARQHRNGYIKGWVMTDGSAPQKLCLIEHSDGPIWLILCFVNIIEMSGRPEYYDKLISYEDGGEATVLEHLRMAARYMGAKVGAHGMCLMLDGDWTDPLNGPGRKGKGESTWNTAALIFAIRRLCSVFPDEEMTAIADRLAKAMNDSAWDGAWYYAGIDDEGRPYGSHRDPEAKQFLNAQSFAVMAGAVPADRLPKVVESMEQLKIDTGYLLFAPEFTEYNPIWGRISAKNPGTAENGCAYCHGTMFKAGADLTLGNGDRALETLYSVLPINPKNPTEKNLQSPTFIPNFYFSLQNENFGRSSQAYGTGSVSWFLHMMVEKVLGIVHTTHGVEIRPNLPSGWDKVKVTRRYRGEIREYTVEK